MAEKLSVEQIKAETLRLYNSLPQEEEARKARIDVRDRVIELNYKFFGYIASHTYVQGWLASYEDKLQSALMHFCECWWWYMWEQKYRTDLSFAVFFKLRIGEMIDRELTEVKYATRRTMCMKAGNQVGKHWAKVRYEDLANVNLPVESMNSLKAIFGATNAVDISDCEPYLLSTNSVDSPFTQLSDEYNSIEDLLIHEMVDNQSKLTPKLLNQIAEIYSLDINLLRQLLPQAEQRLYNELHAQIDINDVFQIQKETSQELTGLIKTKSAKI